MCELRLCKLLYQAHVKSLVIIFICKKNTECGKREKMFQVKIFKYSLLLFLKIVLSSDSFK